MRSRNGENVNKEIRTARGAFTHLYNESSPRPARLGLNEHVIKPESLNVTDMGAD